MNVTMFCNAQRFLPTSLRHRAGSKAFIESPKPEVLISAWKKVSCSKPQKSAENTKPAIQDDAAMLKPEAWEALIASRQLGYFALLRNLRTIMISVPHCLDDVIAMLTDEAAIDRSQVLPFSFIAALEAVSKHPPLGVLRALTALSDAADLSLVNMPKFIGRTLVALDGSKSMSGRSLQIGSLLAASLTKTNDAEVMLFDKNARHVALNHRDNIVSLARQLESQCTAASTHCHSIFQQALRGYDRVIILSDQQCWNGSSAPTATFARWKAKHRCEPKVYSINLSGSDAMHSPEQDVFCLAGWSDESLSMLHFLDSGN